MPRNRIPIYTQDAPPDYWQPPGPRRPERFLRWLDKMIDRACNWRLALAILALALVAPLVAKGCNL